MKTKMFLSSFFCLLFFGLSFNLAGAIEYGQMGGKPTNFDPNIPDSKAWFIYNLDPGTSKEDSLTVANLFNESWIAVIYAADSIKSSSGGFALRQLTEPKEAVGTWVRFYPDAKPDFANKVFENKKTIDEVCKVSSDDLKNNFELAEDKISELGEWCKGKDMVELDLKAGEKKELIFVISIPDGAEVGEHTGGILIQKKAKDETAQNDGSKVMLTTRVGVRIYETVPGNIIKKLAFTDFNVAKNFEEFYFPWDKLKKEKFREYIISSGINNSGNVSTNFSENIVIENLITKKVERIDNREFQVLRGDNFTSTLAWKAPRLAYLSFQKEYTYKDAADNEQKISTEMITKWFIPWRELTIFFVLAFLASVAYILWKKYQKKYYGAIGWVDYEVSDGETVQSLIKKFAVDWKTFIKTNKIKKPYLLEAGQMIKVPGEDKQELIKEDVLPESNFVEKESAMIQEIPRQKINDSEELSDADILNRKELFDSATEKKESPVIEVDEIIEIENVEREDLKSEAVDSSLFFAGDDFKKKEEGEKENNEPENQSKKETKKSTLKIQPLRKATDIQAPRAVIVETIAEEVIAEKEIKEAVAIENDSLTIVGSKDDIKSSFKWIVIGLGAVIIILLATVVYLLLNNKKATVVPNQAETSADESKKDAVVPENVLTEEKKEEVEVAKEEVTDPLKMKIEVYNGSGVAGAAGKVKDFLTGKKYENVEAKNYSSSEIVGSTVYYKEEKLKEEAQWLADILKDNDVSAQIKLASTEEEKNADVVIILGK